MKKFTLLASILVCICLHAISQTLNSIAPNQGYQGQVNLTTTISGTGLFIQTSSPSGNVYQIYIDNGVNQVFLYQWSNFPPYDPTTVLSADSALVKFNIPSGTPTGLYDLTVVVGDPLYPPFNTVPYILPGAFTVIPPDGFITGSTYFDNNLNGVKDATEPPAASQKIRMMPDSAIVTTDALGNYTFPVTNGTYTIDWLPTNSNYMVQTSSPQSYMPTVNNNTISGNDFGIISSLVAIVPNQGYQGQLLNATITARGIFTVGSTPNISLYRPGQTIFANTPSIIIVDSNTVTCTFNIPGGAPIAGYELDVQTNLVQYHKLSNAFDVIPYPAYISGNIFFDSNLNKVKDAGEPNMTNQRVILNNDSVFGFTDSQGNYSVGTFNGPHNIAWDPAPGSNLLLSTDSVSYTFTNAGSLSGFDFGLKSNYPDYSTNIILTSGLPRCNNLVNYTVTYKNLGTLSINGRVYVIKDPAMAFNSSVPVPDNISGDTLFWNYTGLQAFQPAVINIVFLLPGGGNTISTNAVIEAVDGSSTVQTTVNYLLTQTVACSFDPNDKAATPPGVQSLNYTSITDTLEYLIRFQNTGNDTAFNVVIYDQLDINLDLNTFNVIASSHPVSTELKSTGEAIFTFANILLADSNVNEPESHGWVRYSVVPKAGIPDYSPVYNTAYIVFDANPPVVTNTTLNTLVVVIPNAVAETTVKHLKNALLYPNPFDETAKLVFDNPYSDEYIFSITDINGRVVVQSPVNSGEVTIQKNSLKAGMYFYHLNNGDDSVNYDGKFVIR
ncbi:MAG: T9SS type A sorting domain-containing protein [Bacteroidia bacterium]